jgi:6-pyruvoyltetrahydropterin/6-carboxytetrahydropterin synthase
MPAAPTLKINEVYESNPTIEIMCAWFWQKLAPPLPGLAEIVVHETPSARCSYRGK